MGLRPLVRISYSPAAIEATHVAEERFTFRLEFTADPDPLSIDDLLKYPTTRVWHGLKRIGCDEVSVSGLRDAVRRAAGAT